MSNFLWKSLLKPAAGENVSVEPSYQKERSWIKQQLKHCRELNLVAQASVKISVITNEVFRTVEKLMK